VTIDLAFRDVRVLDGTGAGPVEADVGVDGERIVAVGTVGAARREVDGGGRILSPGFVDVHSHDDGALIRHPDMAFKLAQGCTTVVIGNCGYSAVPPTAGGDGNATADTIFGVGPTWSDLDGYADAVAAARPAVNAVALVGHNSVRTAVMGEERRDPEPAELEAMRAHVRAAMEQGACGFSTGLVYQPGRWAGEEEIVELAREAAPFGGLYATHMRNEGDRLLESVEEAIRIGRDAGTPVQISHHKAAGRRNWGKVAESLALVHAANEAGADVTLDVYPYVAGSGPMWQYFDAQRPDPELAASIRIASCLDFPELEGRMLVDVAADEGVPVTEVVTRVLTAPQAKRTVCIQFLMDEADVETNLRDPLVMVGSDGIVDLRGRPHPRLFGTFPRVLGLYVRARGVLGLEEAVRRMTSLSADRFGLVDRGRVVEGAVADLVLFDPGTVLDTATWDEPQQEPVGIGTVVVNGTVAYDEGRHLGAGTGRLLRFRPPT
jgi:N-acyl-D-amino-acid deacylase